MMMKMLSKIERQASIRLNVFLTSVEVRMKMLKVFPSNPKTPTIVLTNLKLINLKIISHKIP